MPVPASTSATAAPSDDGSDPHGNPPNNWMAAFGGSAWTRVADGDAQWYLGTFTPHQPDFDHTNVDVQKMFADVLEFWFDRGVEGFRVDAISPVGKDPRTPRRPSPAAGYRHAASHVGEPVHRVPTRRPRRVAAVPCDDRRLHGSPPRSGSDDGGRGLHERAARSHGRVRQRRAVPPGLRPSTCCCRRGSSPRSSGRSATRWTSSRSDRRRRGR